MTEASGLYHIGEARSAMRILAGRLFGLRRFQLVALMAFLFVSIVGAMGIVNWLVPPDRPGNAGASLIAISITCAVAYSLYVWWWRVGYVKAWERRGVENPTQSRFTVEDAALVVASGPTTTRVEWRGIIEIAPSPTHWIFVGNGIGYCLPKRFFGDKAAERAFIDAALSRMNEAARERSREAVAFTRVWTARAVHG
ncbi:MAG: YcxB family protein [Caulobacterales bacterium]